MPSYPHCGWDFPEEIPESVRKDPGNALRAFPEIPWRVRLGTPKPYNSRHLEPPEHFDYSLPLTTRGLADTAAFNHDWLLYSVCIRALPTVQLLKACSSQKDQRQEHGQHWRRWPLNTRSLTEGTARVSNITSDRAANLWEPARPLQRSFGPSAPEMPRKSRKCLPGPEAPGPPKSQKSLGESPASLRRVSGKCLQSVFGVFRDFLGSRGRRPRETFSRLFLAFRARRARETSVTLRLLNALNSEDRGLKVRFSLATIAFDRESAQMSQMLSSQGKNAPSDPYPHYLKEGAGLFPSESP